MTELSRNRESGGAWGGKSKRGERVKLLIGLEQNVLESGRLESTDVTSYAVLLE